MPTAHVNGFDLAYEDRGEGPPLLLLHAFPFDSRMWRAQLDRLADRNRLIAPDLRGFGRSRYDQPFTMELLAEDCHALMEQLGLLPYVVLGKSMGGYVAMELVRRYPDDLRGLVLAGSRAQGESSDEKIKRVNSVDDIHRAGKQVHIEKMMGRLLSAQSRARHPGLQDELRGIMEDCTTETMIHGILAIMSRPDHMRDFAALQAPTLVLVGAEDELTPPALSEEMHRAKPGSRLEIFEGCGHMSALEDPDRFARVVRSFLEEVERPDAHPA